MQCNLEPFLVATEHLPIQPVALASMRSGWEKVSLHCRTQHFMTVTSPEFWNVPPRFGPQVLGQAADCDGVSRSRCPLGVGWASCFWEPTRFCVANLKPQPHLRVRHLMPAPSHHIRCARPSFPPLCADVRRRLLCFLRPA